MTLDRSDDSEESTAASLTDSLDATEGGTDPLRERMRVRAGLSKREWTAAVSLLTFLPYPVFLYLMLTDTVTGMWFLLFTLAYSLVAAYLNYMF